MIKIFNADDRNFGTNGNIAIKPIKCIETKKKSLNGWYIDVEIPIEYKDYIDKDKLFVVKTKSKLNPQAFFIKDDVEIKYTKTKIIFQAEHVMFMARDYFLVDVRPTNLNGASTLNYINERTDKTSPFLVNSDVDTVDTAYFIRKSLLEAWATIEERWGGVFDADNWNIELKQNVGQDRGEIIAYGKNLQNIKAFEDWSNVVTRLYPTGKDGLMLPEEYLESTTQYDKPYTRTIVFETELEEELQTEENLILELRANAISFLETNQFPMVSYEVTSDINQELEIGDTIHVKHPLVNLLTEVLEYESDRNTEKVKKIIFGNFTRDVKAKFDAIKYEIKTNAERLTSQEAIVNHQTNLINSLNKTGLVYIDENEVLILDTLPREEAKNIWRLGLGGFAHSSNGYEGPFNIALTQDGTINADFIKGGTIDGALIKAGSITADKIDTSTFKTGGDNVINDSTAIYNNGSWDGEVVSYSDTETKQNTDSQNVIYMQNNTRKQIIQRQNGIYSIAFKYKKLITLANPKIKINGYEIILDSEIWKKEHYTFEVLSNTIEIEFSSDTDNSCWLGDLICRSGSVAGVWSSAPGESAYGGVKISNFIEVDSTTANTKTTMNDDGFRVYNKTTNEVVQESTDKGGKFKHLEAESSKIAGILRQKVGNQVWDTWVG